MEPGFFMEGGNRDQDRDSTHGSRIQRLASLSEALAPVARDYEERAS